jgi:hypothetical protein
MIYPVVHMNLGKITGFVILLLLASCKEDAEITAGIEGRWQGTLAEIQLKPFGLPVPIRRDVPSFSTRIDFDDKGTVTLWDDGNPREGSYQVDGDELILNIDYSIEDVSLSGTYNIEVLNQEQLVINLKRNDKFADPDGGLTVSGQIKITLHFERI